MKHKTYKRLWAGIQITLLIVPILLCILWVPYKISHDQHMVDTVNERAMNYEPANGTMTDFADATIMENDAQIEYEERVWMLENPEVYYIKAWGMGILIAIVCQTGNLFWALFYDEIGLMNRWD